MYHSYVPWLLACSTSSVLLTFSFPQRNPRLIGQSHHESILREHLAKYGTQIELGVELVGFTQDQDGVIAELLHHAGENQGKKETTQVDYLVGAEGARSE